MVLDDAHAGENCISSNWSLQIDRKKNGNTFLGLVDLLKGKIDDQIFLKITDDFPDPFKKNWIEKLAFPHFLELKNEIFQLLELELSETPLVYSWLKIKDSLHACNLYYSWEEILIRPLIPPSEDNIAFSNANQRIFMSATLGNGGDLERISGTKNICRIPIPKGWDKQGLVRRFFIFPQESLEKEEVFDSLIEFFKYTPRAVIIVSSDKKISEWEDSLKDQIKDLSTFRAKDIEQSKELFLHSEKAVVLLANRFDGIDFAAEESRLLVLADIPYSANIQEKFIQSRMNASIIFFDRNRTRLIQAIGRCTRSPKDYAAVLVLGEGLFDWFSYDDKIRFFHPDLQGELKFGKEQSKGSKASDLIENFQVFLNQDNDTKCQETAESQILYYRDGSIQQDIPGEKELSEVASKEVDFTYALWNKQFEEAIKIGSEIFSGLSGGSELKGYRAFWCYMTGNAAWLAYKESEKEYFKSKAKELYDNTIKISPSISWLRGITEDRDQVQDEIDTNFSHNIDNLEGILLEYKIHKIGKFTSTLSTIRNDLSIHDRFEDAQEKVGKLLGFETGNSTENGAPDPYWISHNDFVIVFEDKLYDSGAHPIRLNDITQALRHESWIRKNLKQLISEAEVYTVFLSNRSTISQESEHACDGLLYWEYEEFLTFSKNLISFMTDLRNIYSGRGDNTWKDSVIQKFISEGFRPRDIVKNLPRLIDHGTRET